MNPSATLWPNNHSVVNTDKVPYFCLRDTTIRISMIPIAVAIRINTADMGTLGSKNKTRDSFHCNNTWMECHVITCLAISLASFHLCWKQVWRWSHQNSHRCSPSFWTSPWLHILCLCEGRRCLPACPCHFQSGKQQQIKPALSKITFVLF